MISINGKKKEKKKKKKKEEEAAADNEGVIDDCVGNLLAAASTGRKPCFVVFLFSLFFFFFFLTNPFVQDLKLSDLLPIFVLLCVLSFLLDLIITSYQCIGQNSLEKLKQKETVRTSKTGHSSENCTVQPRFTESGGQTAIHVGPYFFLHGTVLHPKQTVKLKGSRIF